MEVRYCPDDRYKMTIKAMGAVLTNVDGHMRWVVTTDADEKYILRPESALTNDDK